MPGGGLVMDSAVKFCGTASSGGSQGDEAIFDLKAASASDATDR